MKRIGVFTSGGDSPGMNACIRSVVRTALNNGLEVVGIKRGYEGMIYGEIEEMSAASVSNIIHRGGTILKTARSQQFMTSAGMELAANQIKKKGIEGLVAIGGDGTFRGALEMGDEFDIPIIGAPGTIDNDLFGTDLTIGYDTALNTVVDAVDKIRDTAESHNRLFFVEVMGKDAGLIALRSGIAVGAEAILIPETQTDIGQLIQLLQKGWKRQKGSSIIIVAEGDDAGGAFEVAKKVKERFDQFDTRVSILGHMQRGGNPSAIDRVLASRLGMSAVEALIEGRKQEMAGVLNNEVAFTPFENATKHHAALNSGLLRLAEILSA